MNCWNGVGNLTKDPELRYTNNGTAVATFTVAINRPYANQQGEREADYINVVVWRKPAENCANFLKKGSSVAVTGMLQSRSYEGQDGKRVYIWEVVAEHVKFLSSPNKQNEQPSSPSNSFNNAGGTNTSRGPQNPPQGNNDPFAYGQPIHIDDDSLPF